MRILIVHNHYGNYAIGGESSVMNAEVKLLRSHGHDVFTYERTNNEFCSEGFANTIFSFIHYTWSLRSYYQAYHILKVIKPDIMHVHNYKWLLTPSVFKAAKDLKIPTIHTLHNYWLAAPCASLMKYGKICELCLEKNNPIYILKFRCRKEGSLFSSLLNYLYFLSIEKRGKLFDLIDIYIALTEFAKQKFIKAGLPKERIFVKPNFLEDPVEKVKVRDDGYALFVGRLSFEKGAHFMVDAWDEINYPLKVVGDGPQKKKLINQNKNVQILGWKNKKEVLDLLAGASFYIFPSLSYEGFPVSLLEAMAMGKPIVASDLGARSEMIQNNEAGLLYKVYSKGDFVSKVKWIIDNKSEATEMGYNARNKYLNEYNPESNYIQLLEIYKKAIEINKSRIEQSV